MSMVFAAQDTAILEGLEKGDTLKFYAVEKDGEIIIEELGIAK